MKKNTIVIRECRDGRWCYVTYEIDKDDLLVEIKVVYDD